MLERAAPRRAIEGILRSDLGERFFADSRVRWRQGRDNRPGKTMPEADAETRRLVNLLRRIGQRDDDALDLADKLATCSNDQPCVSGAWPAISAFARSIWS